MEAARWQERLRAEAAALGVAVEPRVAAMLWAHWQQVKAAGRRFNLTAIHSDEEALVLHYLDSLAPLAAAGAWPAGGTLADIGSGAGFPGIPLLAALGEAWRGVLVEAQGKRARFLAGAVEGLGLAGRARVLACRAEEAGRHSRWRERMDAVVVRALARLDVVAEYGLPLLRPGGRLWAYKGPQGEQEVAACRAALAELGGQVAGLRWYELPGGAGRRLLVEVVKAGATPPAYPRRPGIPAKRPLAGRRAGPAVPAGETGEEAGAEGVGRS